MKISNAKKENTNVGMIDNSTTLPTPDRIIYKNADNKYIIVDSERSTYAKIYSELYNRVTNAIDGKVYSDEEISRMQDNGRFIEFDYNNKSKNFVFMLEEDEIGIIKRLSDGGQVIQTFLNDKEDLIKKIEDLTKNEIKYDFNKNYNYVSENTISEIDNKLLSTTNMTGVYQAIIKDDAHYNEMLEKLNFKTSEELPKVNFDEQSVVIVVSRYEVQDVKQSIGNIKYELGNFCDKYNVCISIVSKIVNTNCIYYNTNMDESGVSQFVTNNDKDSNQVEYFVANGKYYIIQNDIKTEIISEQKAAEIAENEAKKEKYQYQGWKSDFRVDEYDGNISGDLILGLDDIYRLNYWSDEWKVEEYKNKIMWQIRLFDENDPLTSLYIYVDAINGNIIGAGKSSD